MGAAQSAEPRSVSMENPGPAGIFDISDEVVQRLKEGIHKQATEKNAKSKAEAPPPPPSKPKQVPVKATSPIKTPGTAVAPTPSSPPPAVYQNPVPAFYAMSGATTITAADIRRQKEIELQANDALWRQRMEDLTKMLNKTNTIMENEYSSAVSDVKQRFANAPARHQLPPCQDLKTQLIACFRVHSGETLKCSEEVEQFRNCVNAHRLKRLDAEKEQVKPNAAVSKTPPAKAG